MRARSGAILVGGRSERMGRDKATLLLPDGRVMFEAVAASLRTICDDLVLVGSDNRFKHAEGYSHLPDLRPGSGPLAGIEALLKSNRAHEYLVCPCDVPLITPTVLMRLLDGRHAKASVLHIAGRESFEPLPARIAADALPVVQSLLDAGSRSVWRLMESLPAHIVHLEAACAATLHNCNKPDDLPAA
jgi:molybdopterin-guanine dinucleotide biosynthesis protein A